MSNLIKAFPLYNFLNYCNSSNLSKKVLDCGAGGSIPPLSLFKNFGYEVFGIEISYEQIKKTMEFENIHNTKLNISHGDMLNLPFSNASFSFVYSFNTSVHMKKADFKKAISEFSRVIKKGGLCFINFLSEECDTYKSNENVNIRNNDSKNDDIRFTHYKKDEVMKLINEFELVYFEEKKITRYINNNQITSGFYDLILKK